MVAPVIAAIEEAAKVVVEIVKDAAAICELTKQSKGRHHMKEKHLSLIMNNYKRSR